MVPPKPRDPTKDPGSLDRKWLVANRDGSFKPQSIPSPTPGPGRRQASWAALYFPPPRPPLLPTPLGCSLAKPWQWHITQPPPGALPVPTTSGWPPPSGPPHTMGCSNRNSLALWKEEMRGGVSKEWGGGGITWDGTKFWRRQNGGKEEEARTAWLGWEHLWAMHMGLVRLYS